MLFTEEKNILHFTIFIMVMKVYRNDLRVLEH